MKSNLGSALRMVLGSDSVNVSEFVQSAFGQLKPLYNSYTQKLPASDSDKGYQAGSDKSLKTDTSPDHVLQDGRNPQNSVSLDPENKGNSAPICVDDAKEDATLLDRKHNGAMPPYEYFWKNFADSINQSVLKKLGVSLPEIRLWEGFDLLNKMSIQSQKSAEEEYVQSGLATPMAALEIKTEDSSSNVASLNAALFSLLDIRKASWDVLSQTEAILGALMVIAANISQQKKDSVSSGEEDKKTDTTPIGTEDVARQSPDNKRNITVEVLSSDMRKEDEMKKIFSSAESAMEAWTMLATSLGRNSFIKSEFEKICFLDNLSTDTQASFMSNFLCSTKCCLNAITDVSK